MFGEVDSSVLDGIIRLREVSDRIDVVSSNPVYITTEQGKGLKTALGEMTHQYYLSLDRSGFELMRVVDSTEVAK